LLKSLLGSTEALPEIWSKLLTGDSVRFAGRQWTSRSINRGPSVGPQGAVVVDEDKHAQVADGRGGAADDRQQVRVGLFAGRGSTGKKMPEAACSGVLL
jgi:hypothetical protein